MDEQTQRLRIRAEDILNQLSAIEDELREKEDYQYSSNLQVVPRVEKVPASTP